MNVTIYTDGSCNNRSELKIGGYACMIRYSNGKELVLYGGEFSSTSARMELIAIKVALDFLVEKHKEEKISLDLFTDAQYIVHSINKGWLWDWVQLGFITTKNSDVWKEIIRLMGQSCLCSIKINHVKGHSGIEYNEKADHWADFAVRQLIEINNRNKTITGYDRVQSLTKS